jgi:uncharacterized membrane protein YhaH (DUF805 family)
MDFRALLLSSAGRVNREDFWISFLVLAGVDLLVLLVPLVGWLVVLASTYCWVCLYIKRLHDMGKPAWLITLPYGVWLIPVVAAVVMGGMAAVSGLVNGVDSGTSFSVLAGLGGFLTACGVSFLVGVAFLLWMGLTPGEAGDNRYGSPPRAQPVFPHTASEPPSEPPAT